MERTYTIPLRRGFRRAVSYKKTNKAVSTVRNFIIRHMKSEDVAIGKELNELLWKHGAKNPPARVRVTAVKEDDKVSVNLEGIKVEKKVEKDTPKKKVEEKIAEKTEKKAEKETKTEKKEEKNPVEKAEATEKKEAKPVETTKEAPKKEEKVAEKKQE